MSSYRDLPIEIQLEIIAQALPNSTDFDEVKHAQGLEDLDDFAVPAAHRYSEHIPPPADNRRSISFSRETLLYQIWNLLSTSKTVRSLALDKLARSPIFIHKSFEDLIQYLRLMHSTGFIQHVSTIVFVFPGAVWQSEIGEMTQIANYLALFSNIRLYFIWEEPFEDNYIYQNPGNWVAEEEALRLTDDNLDSIAFFRDVIIRDQYPHLRWHGLLLKEKWCKINGIWWKAENVPLVCLDWAMEMEVLLSRVHHIVFIDDVMKLFMDYENNELLKYGKPALETRSSPLDT